jgi:hypothetical protein
MSDDTNTHAVLVIYADAERHAGATCNQDLQVQPEAIEKLRSKGGKDVA